MATVGSNLMVLDAMKRRKAIVKTGTQSKLESSDFRAFATRQSGLLQQQLYITDVGSDALNLLAVYVSPKLAAALHHDG